MAGDEVSGTRCVENLIPSESWVPDTGRSAEPGARHPVTRRHQLDDEGAGHQSVVYVRAMAERWTAQWKELYAEVVTTGLCTGCSACVVTCPHDVIGYEHEEGKYLPFHLEEELGLDNCIHGEKGCTTCTRACPRFRAWEPSADMHLFGRVREPDEMYGIWRELLLTRASDAMVHRTTGAVLSSVALCPTEASAA